MNRFLGKKKQGKKKQAKTAPVPQPPTHHGTHSTTAPSAHDVPKPAAAVKSLDDQSYSKWVEDHNNEEDQYIEEEGEEAIVLYNYTPNPQSEIDDEIALEKDEIIMVYEQHPSGWWTGQSAKHGYGLFPGSFVKLRSATGPTPSAPPALPSTTSSGSSISSSSASTSSNTTGSSIASTSSHPPSSSTSSLTATSSAASASTGTTTTPTPSSTTASIPSSADHTSNQEHPTTAQKPERPPVIRTSSSSGSFDGSHEKEGSSISSDGSYRASRGGSLLGTGTDDEPAPAKRSPSHIIRTGSASSLPVRPLAEGDSGDSVYLKSILDKLQDRVSTLHQQVPQIESAHRSSLSELELLRAENAELKKIIEEMKIEKELASWKHDKEVSELRKELATLTESQASSASSEAGSGSGVGAAAVESLQAEIARLTTSLAQERANVAELSEQVRSAQHASSPDEEVSKLKDALARESAALTLEKASNAEQVSMLLRTQLQIREELEDVRAQLREQQTLAKMAAPPPMPAGATPEDFMAHIKSYMDQKTAQMQADLLNLKKEVAKEHQTDSSLEQELAALRRQLDNEQRERAKLRQDLIDQMTASQIHRIRHDVLQRAEVKEGKLWDPVNNVFLAADGKWLRPTGIDLTN